MVTAALDAVERGHDVSVIAARDFGSHAWNTDDPDSDRDIALVYVQPAVEYATLGTTIESIDDEYDGIDVSGWNVRRFGELLVDSNPTMLEFLHSPLVYRDCDALTALAGDVGDRFEPIRLYHHYRSLAVQNAVDAPTVKRALYVLRARLYAEFVLETHRFPTLDFPAFLEAERDRFAPSLVDAAQRLVNRKRTGAGGDSAEIDLHSVVADLPTDVDPEAHAVRGISTERVNAFIRAVVTDASGEPS